MPARNEQTASNETPDSHTCTREDLAVLRILAQARAQGKGVIFLPSIPMKPDPEWIVFVPTPTPQNTDAYE